MYKDELPLSVNESFIKQAGNARLILLHHPRRTSKILLNGLTISCNLFAIVARAGGVVRNSDCVLVSDALRAIGSVLNDGKGL